MIFLIIAYIILLSFLTWRNFALGVYVVLCTIPTYFIRSTVGLFPITLLEVGILVIILVGLVTVSKKEWKELYTLIQKHRLFASAFVGLLLFSAVSVYTSTIGAVSPSENLMRALGEWKAFFLEPMALFVILMLKKHALSVRGVVLSLVVAGACVSVVAIIQKFTGALFPPSLWNDQLFGRVTSIFTTPNAIGLFTVPIMFFALIFVPRHRAILTIGLISMLLANIFSISQGAWVALGCGVIVYVFVRGYRKVAYAIVAIGLVAAVMIPSLQQAVLFQDTAGQNRLLLWEKTVEYLGDSPKNFFLGTGIRNFYDEVQKPFHDPRTLEPLKYPHTLVLNFWSEIGLFGMITFVLLLGIVVASAYQIKDPYMRAGALSALTGFVVHGLVDVPYFKNDLAVLFWIIVWIVFVMREVKKLDKI